jgi:hypothetical protein
MPKGKRNFIVGIITVAAGGWLVTGCSASAHISIGGTPSVSKHDVETEVATTLAKQQNQPVPKVVCPGDLKAKIGTVMYCSLTAKGSTTAYPVKLRVNSVSGKQAHFNIVVSKTPGHFTAPS